jgi:hypothetical protein
MSRRVLLIGVLFGGVACAVAAEAPRAAQPDLVVSGVSCDTRHPTTFFSFSLARSGEATFSGIVGVRELGERSARVDPQAAARLLKSAAKLRHRRDSKPPEDEPSVCVRIAQPGDSRPHLLQSQHRAWDFLGELASATPFASWACPGRQRGALEAFCTRWYRAVFWAEWQECSATYDAVGYPDGTIFEAVGERPSGSDAPFTRTERFVSVPREGMERVMRELRNTRLSGEYMIVDCFPTPCMYPEPPYTSSPPEIQSFWNLLHQHVGFEGQRPRGDKSCLRPPEEKFTVPDALGPR